MFREKNTDEIGEPLKSICGRVSRPLLDNIIDHGFDPGVDVGSEIALDFLFLFGHGLK